MDYLTAFMVGLVGSLHCAGMCGPLALALPGHNASTGSFVLGRVAYNLGRIVTYSALGLCFGLLGRTLLLAGVQRWVSLALGLALLVGFFNSGRLATWFPIALVLNRVKSGMASFLRDRSAASLMVLGMLNGLLPCGLVYVACAGTTTLGGAIPGIIYMVAFGAGTLPMMLAISLSGSLVPLSLRLKLRHALPAAICLLAALLILRGMALGVPYLSPDLNGDASCCHK